MLLTVRRGLAPFEIKARMLHAVALRAKPHLVECRL